jgi:superfamily II DNA or RNA helicase
MKIAQLRTKEGMQAWEDGSADVYIINSEMLLNKEEALFKRKTLPVNTIVIDELSLAKNPTSKRFKVLRRHLKKFNHRIGLTGTPIPNDYLDLYGQIRLLDDGQRLGKSFSAYKNEFFYQADFMGYSFKLRSGAKEQIDNLLSDLCLVITGDDSDLPASSVMDIPVVLPAEARKKYRELEKELLIEIKDKEIVALNAATLCGKLLQITGGAVYGEEKEIIHIHDAKIDALKKLRKQHGTEPILVLTAFKHESVRILAAIDGAEMFNEKRLDAWQRGEIHTWVADPRSLSHGIDGLQKSGRIAVWFTLTYSNETYLQTNARLIRTGQSAETLIYRLVSPNTIDDAVAEALREKTNIQTGLMGALKALQTMARQ